jgi:hypothetical protein
VAISKSMRRVCPPCCARPPASPASKDTRPDGLGQWAFGRCRCTVKPSDSRAERYIQQYGERCWETDILPAAVIEQALDDHVRSWLDGKLWQRRAAEIEGARALL